MNLYACNQSNYTENGEKMKEQTRPVGGFPISSWLTLASIRDFHFLRKIYGKYLRWQTC